MSFNENDDEIEHLRLIALKSMVRRSKKNSSDNNAYDQELKLLRAEALKTITCRRNTQNNSLINKNEEHVTSQIVNKRKRSISDISSLRKKKSINLNENKITNSKDLFNCSNIITSSKLLKDDHKQEYKCKPIPVCNTKSQSKPQVEYIDEFHCKTAVNESKGNFKKIFKNGCMQLSNLDSEKIVESMIVTFNSSESDDLSSECDTIMNENATQKTRYNNLMNLLQIPVDVKTTNSISSEDNKLKINNCLKKLCGLMKKCEANIEKRNKLIKILLEVHKEYQSYNKSISSVLQMMKIVHDELSHYHSLEVNTA